jgi:hypothetical protein
MDSQTWDLVARMFAILVGVGLGSAAIITATAVWGRRQIFGYGGSALCLAGVILLGLSIYSSVKLAISATSGIVFEGIAFGPIKFRGEEPTLDGKPISVPKGATQIGFWTPSSRTKEAADVKDWEIVESDAKLDQFAERLMKAKILEGYRRYEVIGAGVGSRKIGAWWVSTNSGEFKLSEFLAAYKEFWKPGEDTTYMEIVPLSSGGYQPPARKLM